MSQYFKKTFTFWLVFLLFIISMTNGAEDSSSSSSSINSPMSYEYNEDADPITSTGPDDDLREDFYDENDETSYVLDDEDQEDETDTSSNSESKATIEKRNLGALARQGDAAARRIYAPWALTPYTYHDDDIWSANEETMGNSEKRNIGSLAKGGFHKLRYSAPRPSGFSKTTSWISKPKRLYNEDENPGQESLYDNEYDEDLYSMAKKNIASLARKGTLTQLRMQRRPMPWISDEDYEYNDRMRAHDGYKRNIQTLARIATPGSGFRSWLRGRLHSQSSPESKRRFHNRFGLSTGTGEGGGRYSLFGRGRLGVKDRFRGVRSTREMNNIVQGSPSFRSSFRAPMAFVSRHIWKRAIGDVLGDVLLRRQMSTQQRKEQNRGATPTTQSPLQGHNNNIDLTP